jgi:exodeoxyribonuclease VII small subunit
MSKTQTIDPDTTFEQALGRLEEIAGDMEARRLSLFDMIDGYEEGSQLLKICRLRLDQARQRIDQINAKLDAEAAAELTPFNPDSSSEQSPAGTEAKDPATTRPAKKTTSTRRPAADDSDSEIRLF